MRGLPALTLLISLFVASVVASDSPPQASVRGGELWITGSGQRSRQVPNPFPGQEFPVSSTIPPVRQPGGAGFAFVRSWQAASDTISSLWYVRADGSGQRRLLRNGLEDSNDVPRPFWNGDEGRLSWAPDGRAILAQCKLHVLGRGQGLAEQRGSGHWEWQTWLAPLNERSHLVGISRRLRAYRWVRRGGGYTPVINR